MFFSVFQIVVAQLHGQTVLMYPHNHLVLFLTLLCVTAALIGIGHTLCGPDHYLPFIVVGKARGWTLTKTLWITFLCGIGHVLGSVALGVIGATLGVALGRLELFEAWRGNLAAQALIIFGFTYCVWGIHRALRNKPHTHPHDFKTHSITP